MCVIIIILRNTFADRGCCCRRRWFFPLHLTATSAAACVCVKRFACVSSSYLWCIAIVYYNRYHCAGALCNSIILYYIVALECRQVVGVDLLLHFYMHYVLYIDNLFSFAIIIPLVLTTIMFYFYSSRPSSNVILTISSVEIVSKTFNEIPRATLSLLLTQFLFVSFWNNFLLYANVSR